MSRAAPENVDSPGAIFLRFLKFGLLAWGGPVAQIAMVQRELVERERWIDPARFNRLLAVYQLLPGPEAHELCVHLGRMRGGRLGGLLAGLGFMAPGFAAMLLLAVLYQRFALASPAVSATLAGVQVAVLALIARALHRLAGHALTSPLLWTIGLAVALGGWLGAPFWITLPAAGLVAMAWQRGQRWAAVLLVVLAGLAAGVAGDSAGFLSGTVDPQPATVGSLFLAGLKAGLLTFGGAYSAIPFVRADAVPRGWVSDSQFLDSLALGALVPAPLVMFVTFIGYLAGGNGGALAITAGIFLPAFGFGLALFDRLETLVEDGRFHHALAGVAAGVIGLIGVSAVGLGDHVLTKAAWPAGAIALFLLLLALAFALPPRLHAPLVIALGGAAGLLALKL